LHPFFKYNKEDSGVSVLAWQNYSQNSFCFRI